MADGVDGATTRVRDPVHDARLATCADVFAAIAAGESLLRVLSAEYPERRDDWPSYRTFWRWVIDDVQFRAAYELALTARGEVQAEEIPRLADEAAAPLFDADGNPLLDKDGRVVMCVTREAIAHAALRIDARKWCASRLLPKRYGDRTILAGDADNPLVVDDPKSALLRGLVPHPGPTGTGETDQ